MKDSLGVKVSPGDRVAISTRYGMQFGVVREDVESSDTHAVITLEENGVDISATPEMILKIASKEWPDVKHKTHKNVRSSDASTFDFICDDCGATDDVTGGWGRLREPCRSES